jgi:hypothetical protein
MDIVRAFTDAGLERGVTINIQGTSEDPLFQASQIGAGKYEMERASRILFQGFSGYFSAH